MNVCIDLKLHFFGSDAAFNLQSTWSYQINVGSKEWNGVEWKKMEILK